MSHNQSDLIPSLPPFSSKRIAVRVRPAAERAVRQGHPWLFADSIQRVSFEGKPGDLAVIFDRKDRFMAIGLYDPHSPIRVRILHAGEPLPIDNTWLALKIEEAASRRQSLAESQTDGFRLVHGENDGLPGLIIDRYRDTYVLKLYTAAWVPHLHDLLACLKSQVQPRCVVLRFSRGLQNEPRWLYGLQDGQRLQGRRLPNPVRFLENGLHFEADVIHGQKTGFFLDQRDNRARVERLAAQKKVLNVFAYSGGFSVYAARGGAVQVTSLDISQPALAAALRNFKLNAGQPAVAACAHETLVGDAFRTLRQLHQTQQRYDMVIIDPPAFAKNQKEVDRALTAYNRLAVFALEVLQPGGTLVFASCTSRIGADLFFETIQQAAARSRRPLQEIERSFHALDHPVTFAEGAYLKCLFAKVP